MSARLTDPWFEAEFYGNASATGHRRQGATLNGAQGVFLWCPCAYGDDHRAHGLIIPFANPRGAPPPPPEHGPVNSAGGPRPRWTISDASTGLADLSLTPSVDVGADHCWHGWITGGQVLP